MGEYNLWNHCTFPRMYVVHFLFLTSSQWKTDMSPISTHYFCCMGIVCICKKHELLLIRMEGPLPSATNTRIDLEYTVSNQVKPAEISIATRSVNCVLWCNGKITYYGCLLLPLSYIEWIIYSIVPLRNAFTRISNCIS